jgi:hypothetical protein
MLQKPIPLQEKPVQQPQLAEEQTRQPVWRLLKRRVALQAGPALPPQKEAGQAPPSLEEEEAGQALPQLEEEVLQLLLPLQLFCISDCHRLWPSLPPFPLFRRYNPTSTLMAVSSVSIHSIPNHTQACSCCGH